MHTIFFGFSIDDIGLDGYSTEKQLSEILDFLNELSIKATLFTVPISNEKYIDSQTGYTALLRKAAAQGHEVAQHGLRHDRFEIGIPPEMVLNLPHEGPSRKYLSENREQLKQNHTVVNIQNILCTGRKILENASGTRINGFRSPALQSCPAMFKAIENEQYQYDSSTCLQESAWDILNGKPCIPKAITTERFNKYQFSDTTRELPLSGEYTWYLQDKDVDVCTKLAKHDFYSCAEQHIPFICLCHVGPLCESINNNGLTLYRNLINVMKEHCSKNKCIIKSATLAEISEDFFPKHVA